MPRRSNHLKFLLLLFIALLAITIIARFNAGRDRIPWREDYAAAKRESAATHKLILLDFTASWCGPCQALKTSTWADAKVASAVSSYVPVRIDVDAHAEVAKEFNIQSLPTFLVLGNNGVPMKASEGYLNADDFLAWLSSPARVNPASQPILKADQ